MLLDRLRHVSQFSWRAKGVSLHGTGSPFLPRADYCSSGTFQDYRGLFWLLRTSLSPNLLSLVFQNTRNLRNAAARVARLQDSKLRYLVVSSPSNSRLLAKPGDPVALEEGFDFHSTTPLSAEIQYIQCLPNTLRPARL